MDTGLPNLNGQQMREEDIKNGRWQRRDGLVVIVIGIAFHTEGDYKLVIFNHEGQTDLQATPISVWTEISPMDGSTLFKKVDES
jgi:hypothetical protein